MDIIGRLFLMIALNIIKDDKGVKSLAMFKERLHQP